MELKFKVFTKIRKPVAEVFDAVCNPTKLSTYFTTGGASGPIEPGKRVIWRFGEYEGEAPVDVKEVVPNERITFEWPAGEGAKDDSGVARVVSHDQMMLRVEMTFEALDANTTLVSISEGRWPETQKGLDLSYGNCMGWSQMLSALKAFAEYGINLREGAY